MKTCFSVCLVGFLLIYDVFSLGLDWTDEEEPDIFEIDPVFSEEEVAEDPYVFILNGGSNFNSEENEVETDRKEPKTEVEILRGEEPEVSGFDLGPLPDFEPDLNTLDEKLNKIISEFKAQQDKILELEEVNKRLLFKIDSIEQQTKTNSIILFNVQQNPNESSKTTLQKVLHVFNRIMRVRVSARDIAVALRAETNTSSGNKPIVIRFTNFATKMKILAVKNRLANTDMVVSSDYSEMVAQTRAALVPYLQHAKAEGHRAFILYNKLIVNGVAHTLEELKAQGEAKRNVARFMEKS